MAHRIRPATRPRSPRIAAAAAVLQAAFVAITVSACSSPTGSALPTPICDAAARFASTDPSRSARRLDPVLRDCTSIDDLLAVGAKYGIGLAGDDILRLAKTRCRQILAPRDGSLCSAIMALPSSS